jgi:hypothetical protein
LISNIYAGAFEFGPNLDIVPKVNAAYEHAAEEDKAYHDHILVAHRNFLRDAVYFLYEYNRIGDANYWFKYLGQKYPNKIIIDADPNSYPTNVNLERYVVSRVQEDVEGTPLDRIKGVIEGMIVNSYTSLILDEDAHAEGYRNLARKIWQSYQSRIPQDRIKAIGLPPFEDIARDMANRMLEPNPERGLPAEARAILRTRLGLPAEAAPPATPATNAPPVSLSGK